MTRNTLDIDALDYHISVSEYAASYMFEILLYGVYTVLFFFCNYLLLSSRRTSKWLFLAAAVTMFSITTADTGMTIHYAFRYVFSGQQLPLYHMYPKYLFYVTNNVIANSLMIYRCYVVWHYKKLVIIIPCIALVFTTACGYIFVISRSTYVDELLPVYLWLIFGLNLNLTVLTAGKIFWNARQLRSVLSSEMTGRYYPFSAIIIDSGVIYSIYILLDLVTPLLFFDAGLIQVVGVVPTLIIIRVGLETYNHDAETVDTVQSAEMKQSSTPVLDSVFSTVGAGPAT